MKKNFAMKSENEADLYWLSTIMILAPPEKNTNVDFEWALSVKLTE